MFTSLDLLVVAFMILAALTLLSICLMFLIRNRIVRKVFFYIVSALGLYISWVGFRIGIGGLFYVQIAVGILTAMTIIGAFVLERVSRDNKVMFLIARIVSAAALGVALLNAII